MTPEQLQTNGVLVQLKMGRWDASKRIPKSKLPKEMPKEIVRATNDIVEDRTMLKDMATVRRMAKGYLLRRSLPFPVDGVFWLDKKHVVEVDEYFQEMQQEYFKRRDVVKGKLEAEKKKFKKKYPDYYDEKFYPSVQELDQKYYFYWNFFQMNVPEKETGILSPEMVKQEQQKLRGMVDQMEQMTMNLVGNMLHKRIDRLAKQCNGDSINAGTYNAIERFLNRWDELWRDHVDEKKMKMIMVQLKKHMKSASVDSLKDNDSLRETMGDKLESLIGKLEAIPNFELKRKLDV